MLITAALYFERCREGFLRGGGRCSEGSKAVSGRLSQRGIERRYKGAPRVTQRTLRGRSEDVQMADWQRCTSNTEVDCNTEWIVGVFCRLQESQQ